MPQHVLPAPCILCCSSKAMPLSTAVLSKKSCCNRAPAADVAAFHEHGGNILIGTPGRLSDIIKRTTTMDLKHLEVLVLDEADRLLEMGFKAELDAIMTRLPKQRRTGLHSATSACCHAPSKSPLCHLIQVLQTGRHSASILWLTESLTNGQQPHLCLCLQSSCVAQVIASPDTDISNQVRPAHFMYGAPRSRFS